MVMRTHYRMSFPLVRGDKEGKATAGASIECWDEDDGTPEPPAPTPYQKMLDRWMRCGDWSLVFFRPIVVTASGDLMPSGKFFGCYYPRWDDMCKELKERGFIPLNDAIAEEVLASNPAALNLPALYPTHDHEQILLIAVKDHSPYPCQWPEIAYDELN